MMKCGVLSVCLGLAMASANAQQHDLPLAPTGTVQHLAAALDCLNMTVADLGFCKDVAEPQWALARIRETLAAPLRLPEFGAEAYAAVDADTPAAYATLVQGWLELPAAAGGADVPEAVSVAVTAFSDLSPALADALGGVYVALARCALQIEAALSGVSEVQREYAAASLFMGVFEGEDSPTTQVAVVQMGVASATVARVIADAWQLDPAPVATQAIALAERVDVSAMVGALAAARRSLDAVIALAGADVWPTQMQRVSTPLGTIVVGSAGPDLHVEPALLIVDPGGDDTYGGDVGVANGLGRRPLSVVLDLAGDDRYDGGGMLGPGSALFGVQCLVDVAGRDTYRCAYAGLGAAAFGAAWLEDGAGDDVYQAGGMAQGAADCGFALLMDRQGRDTYDAGLRAQGYAGVRAVGLLVDRDGNDCYVAGGRVPDYDRNRERFLSLSQGFAIGMRPFAGGGVAALVDLAGDDQYVADVYGQGVGYWYALGMLLDRSGEDTYQLYQYGQGSGIHLSLGLLVDGAGRDRYTGEILVQGSAHDFAVGMLIDAGGRDRYTADHHAQGRGINNALGILIDGDGADTYLAGQTDKAQGIGHDGGLREYGSLSLLVDLAGRDGYSCGAGNGAVLIRPDYGVVYDVADAPSEVTP